MTDHPRPPRHQRASIRMSEAEIAAFLAEPNHLTACTINHDGSIHAVAMFYGFVDGAVAFQTKAKSQKVVNLRRDPRLTCLVEAGVAYSELRGVELVGRGEVIEDPALLRRLIVDVRTRYYGPYTSDRSDDVERTARNRVVVMLHAERTVSWDHARLTPGPRRTTAAPTDVTADSLAGPQAVEERELGQGR